MEYDIKLNTCILSSMEEYDGFNGHVAFLISPNGKRIMFVGKSRPLPNYGNSYGICSIHAEKAVLEHLRKDTGYYNLLVFRWNRNGELAMSKPCQNCLKCIKRSRINKVFYSIDKGLTSSHSDDMPLTDSYQSSGFRRLHNNRKISSD